MEKERIKSEILDMLIGSEIIEGIFIGNLQELMEIGLVITTRRIIEVTDMFGGFQSESIPYSVIRSVERTIIQDLYELRINDERPGSPPGIMFKQKSDMDKAYSLVMGHLL